MILPRNALSSAILRKVGAFGIREATLTLNPHAEAIARDLGRRGLLLDRADTRRL
jgi:hypothetical protein